MRPRRRHLTRRALRRATAGLLLLLPGMAVAAETGSAPGSLTPAEISERFGPAVVTIETRSAGEAGQGSGVIVDAAGAIATNLHVVDRAREVTVTLPDGRRFEKVAVRAFDVERDLAVLLVDVPSGSAPLTAAELGDVGEVASGDRVVVIGSPLGLEQTVSQGIVSAWREPREPDLDAAAGEKQQRRLVLPACRLLQISAAISPGSSGGPVFDEQGKVIGLATAGVLYGSAGLNFAVPADALAPLVDEDEALDLVSFREQVNEIRLELARPFYEDARIDLERGNANEAVRRLQRALLYFPEYGDALVLLGSILLEDGQLEPAGELMTLAVAADPESVEAWYGFGAVHDAMAADTDSAAMRAKAREAFERAFELDDRHAGAAFGLAMAHLQQGALTRAEELLQIAVQSDPALVDAHYVLGELLLRNDRTREARDSFERALWEDPDHALAHFGMARLLTHTDFSPTGQAQEHWEAFLRLSEGDPALAEQRELAIRIAQRYFPEALE